MARPVTVIVPIYNAFEYVKLCTTRLLSSLQNETVPVHVIFVDDASTDPRIADHLGKIQQQHSAQVSIITKKQNSGFIAAVNAGFAKATGDVILLNSDTEVFPGWISRLQHTAYAKEHVASVTAISNSASIYSMPKKFMDVLCNRNLCDKFAERLLKECREPLQIPTGVGFCMYLTEAALKKVGTFDIVFGMGYGEENDWCMRASHCGFTHYLDPSVFVLHEGGASMPQKGNPENEALLRAKHPTYQRTVRQFMQEHGHILRKLRAQTEHAAHNAIRENKKMVAQILHSKILAGRIGGTQFNVTDLVLDSSQYDHFVIYPIGIGFEYQEIVDGETIRQGKLEFPRYHKETIPKKWRDIFANLLKKNRVDIVHFHHGRDVGYDLIHACKDAGFPLVLGVHDFDIFGTTPQLVTDGVYRGIPKPDDIVDEFTGTPFSLYKTTVQKWLDRCDAIANPSPSCKEIFLEAFPDAAVKTRVIEHGIAPLSANYNQLQKRGCNRVLIMGYVHSIHKGKHLVDALIPKLIAAGKEVYVLGTSIDKWPQFAGNPNVHFLGLYKKSEIEMWLDSIAPGIAILPSIWPETYCHVISECWRSGVPTCCLNFGAPAERTKKHKTGIVVDSLEADSVVEKVLQALKPAAQQEFQRHLEALRLPTLENMRSITFRMYDTILEQKAPITATDIPLPNFFIIGAQKSGTTWLQSHLKDHPDICMPIAVETHFFSKAHATDADALRAYQTDHYGHYNGEKMIGEKTAALYSSVLTAKRIQQVTKGNAKFIASLRNPVIRALSAYSHYIQRDQLTPTHSITTSIHQGQIGSLGNYASLLKPWYEMFGAERMRTYILEEDIEQHPQETLNDIATFLGVAPFENTPHVFRTIYEGSERFWEGGTLYMNKVRGKKTTPVAIATKHDIESLYAMYEQSIADLETLLGRSIKDLWSLEQTWLRSGAQAAPTIAAS